MAGLKLLGDVSFNSTIKSVLNIHQDIKVDKDNKLIVFCQPLDLNLANNYLGSLISDEFTEEELKNYGIIMPVTGHGLTERHIVAVHVSADTGAGRNYTIYDSKTSDAGKFISRDLVGKGWSMLYAIRGAWRALFKPGFTEQNIKAAVPEGTDSPLVGATYVPLGLQSIFDHAKCGYNTLQVMQAMMACKNNGAAINKTNIMANLKLSSTRDTVKAVQKFKEDVSLNLFSYLKQGLIDTYLPGMSRGEQKEAQFSHYFMGFPLKPNKKKVLAYVVSLRFLTAPLINLTKLPLEFLLFKCPAQALKCLRDNLMVFSPTNPAVQMLRSAALLVVNACFLPVEGLRLLARAITSPINSFRAAKGNRLLQALSIVTSVIGLTALALVSAPLLMMAAPALASVAVASALSISLPAIVPIVIVSLALSATLTLGALMCRGIQEGLVKLAERFSARPKDAPPKQADSLDVDEDDFFDMGRRDLDLQSPNTGNGIDVSTNQQSVSFVSAAFNPRQPDDEIEDDFVLVDDSKAQSGSYFNAKT